MRIVPLLTCFTTFDWSIEIGHEVVLKSESYIRREIDAKCAQDDQECEAIFDDLEDLMNQRGGEWEFKKNRDVNVRPIHDNPGLGFHDDDRTRAGSQEDGFEYPV
jgi:hypothetical protein